MVPQASAVVSGTADAKPVAISADHLNMVKFVFCLNEGYEKVFKYLQLLAEEAPDTISADWEKQNRIRKGIKPILM